MPDFVLTDRHREILDALKHGDQPMLQMGRFSLGSVDFGKDEANELLREGLIARCFPFGFDAVVVTTKGVESIGAPYFRDVDPKWLSATEKVWSEAPRYNQEGAEEMSVRDAFKALHDSATGKFQKDFQAELDESRDRRNAEAAERRPERTFLRSAKDDARLVEECARCNFLQACCVIEHLVERVAELESGFPDRQKVWEEQRKARAAGDPKEGGE